MKIQFLNGGLANQAFQYIFARYYELSHPGEIMYMDDTYFALHTVHNGYELEKIFGIRPHMLSECFDEEVWEYILEERKNGKGLPQILCDNGIETRMISEGDSYRHFNAFDGRLTTLPYGEYRPDILDTSDTVYYHGYWINKNYFCAYQSTFLEEFRFPRITDTANMAYLDRIQHTNSLSVHIRRGDYVGLGFSLDPHLYYLGAKAFVEQAPGTWELFVFSDDIPWCRNHQEELGFGYFGHVTYVEGNMQGRNYLDLQLMSNCKAMLLSNSAFCYLAALLNTSKIYHISLSTRTL